MFILSRFFGSANAKVIEEIQPVVAQINGLEEKMKGLTDEELKSQTVRLKEALANGKNLDDILPEAYATIREAAKRVIGQRHFDVQLLSGIVLHRGQIAEMKTGEGKTLAATAPLYLNALLGQGVHLVTVNDYLARIHADWMGRIYDFLGLSVGCIGQQNISYRFNKNKTSVAGDEILDVQHLESCTRKEAYACDILYGTNNEFGFDYLRDNMVPTEEEKTQRDLSYAIVDEVDSILIDEARTPLIISAPDMESTDKYYQFSKIVTKLAEGPDYNIDEKMRAVTLTDAGIEKVEKILGVDNIYTDRGIRDVHHIEQALKAHALFKKDRDYVVSAQGGSHARGRQSASGGKDGEIVIIDEFTGRMMFGRRYSEGLHQAIEAKENVPVQKESVTMATISFQNYFRMYKKLAGMTGTAATEAEEFSKIYKLEVAVVPTNKPAIRQDLNDKIYKNESGKYQALVEEVKTRHQKGQPVLIGTISIEKNELLAELLAREGITAQVLNAKHHEKEAHIIAQAGKFGAVTVATNMAGRGVDIILGGHPFDEAEYQKVVASGGLCVLGTERHESRRIDNQLRGRSGRQGDPGVSQFFLSMDDDLMRIFGSSKMKSIMTTLGLPDDMPIENKMISKSIEQAQKRVEGNNFDIRKHLVEYDDVMNKHREAIYRKRNQILASGHLIAGPEEEKNSSKNFVLAAIFSEIDNIVGSHTQSNLESEWDLKEIYESVNSIFLVSDELRKNLIDLKKSAGDNQADEMAREMISGYLKKLATARYNELEKNVNLLPHSVSGLEPMRQIENGLLLRAIDTLWIEHLDTMQNLRTGIGLRGYGQRDPLIEYKRESIRLFKQLLVEIDRQVAYSIFKIGSVDQAPALAVSEKPANLKFSAPSKESSEKSPMSADTGLQDRKADMIIEDKSHFAGDKIGRNDPCPCGSGKKFKKCHGR